MIYCEKCVKSMVFMAVYTRGECYSSLKNNKIGKICDRVGEEVYESIN